MSDYSECDSSYSYSSAGPDFEKDADETVDFAFNWSASLEGDAISDSEFSLPDGLTLENSFVSGNTTTVFVSGGSSGRVYRITSRVTTSGGRVYEKTVRVLVTQDY